MRGDRILRGFRLAWLVAGGLALLVAIVSTTVLPHGVITVRTRALVLAIPLATAATQCSAQAWAALAPSGVGHRRALLGFMGAIPAKYLPGAVGQPLGVVGLSAQDRSQVGPISVAFAYSSLLSLAVGVALGLLVLPGGMRLLGLAGTVGIAVGLGRPLPGWLLRRIGMQHAQSKPSVRQLSLAAGWNVAGFSGFGVAAWLLLDGSTPQTLGIVASAFAIAWSAGFAAVVLPAGAGVREGTLVWVLTGVYPADALISMAVQHRMVTLIADLLLVALWRPWRTLIDP